MASSDPVQSNRQGRAAMHLSLRVVLLSAVALAIGGMLSGKGRSTSDTAARRSPAPLPAALQEPPSLQVADASDVASSLTNAGLSKVQIDFVIRTKSQVGGTVGYADFEQAVLVASQIDDRVEVAGPPSQTSRALGYVPPVGLLLSKATLELEHGSYSRARTSYSQVLAADPKSIKAVIGLAKLDQLERHIADAEQGFQRALQLDDDSAAALGALGQFYADQNRLDEAIAILQRARIAAPEDKTILFHYAIALARSGEIRAAHPLLIEAVGSAAANYNLGLILHERGDLAGSEDRFAKAVADNPKLKQAIYWLEELRRERGRPQDSGATDATSDPTADDVEQPD
jgi:tetratricopeptide (TPR) repeat protein